MKKKGMIIVVRRKEVVMKVIANYHGSSLYELVDVLTQMKWPLSLGQVYSLAIEKGLDDPDDLVVMDKDNILFKGTANIDFSLYRRTFFHPNFDPNRSNLEKVWDYMIPIDPEGRTFPVQVSAGNGWVGLKDAPWIDCSN